MYLQLRVLSVRQATIAQTQNNKKNWTVHQVHIPTGRVSVSVRLVQLDTPAMTHQYPQLNAMLASLLLDML
jgi:uncharacterized membrane protein YGL010W